jgi:hypothetical protein
VGGPAATLVVEASPCSFDSPRAWRNASAIAAGVWNRFARLEADHLLQQRVGDRRQVGVVAPHRREDVEPARFMRAFLSRVTANSGRPVSISKKTQP